MQPNIVRKYSKVLLFIPLFLLILSQLSCKKYLDKKPQQNLAVPSTLSDLQAILDNQTINFGSPGDGELMADNYYVTTTAWNNVAIEERRSYIWDKDATITTESSWNKPYLAIYNANFVLDFLPQINFSETERSTYNNLKGTALFARGFLFCQLTQLFCKPYSSTAGVDPGLVLRLTSNVNAPSVRSTLQQTYDQIIADLKAAAELLPVTSLYATRPNKAAVYGALARVYLYMSDYANAGFYANACLALNNTLLDYNTLTPIADPSLPNNFINNPEVLFLSIQMSQNDMLGDSHVAIIDSILYQSYNANDLRKKAFFGLNAGNPFFEGTYAAGYGSTNTLFDGIALDEIYLIRAECHARLGNKDNAMADLNTLLRKRWQTGTFTDFTATDAANALTQILTERRKELIFRGLRWSDLRRYNVEGANITLKRIINGTAYTLPPNDPRWVALIPATEISRSNIPQNPR